MKRFENKVALVTGGRTGIGKAIANQLRQEGARVFTAQRREDQDFESLQLDFTDSDSATTIIDYIIEKASRLDVLVNNAAMMQEISIENMTLDDWNTNITVNLTAPFLLVKAALPYLKESKGNIVNIGSVEGIGANPLHAAYCTTKAGLHGFTRAVAIDCGKYGIRCNAVAPGWVDTELNTDFINSMEDPEKFRKDLAKIHPVGNIGLPQEVAQLVTFLACEQSSYITGEVLRVDGGRMAQLSLP